MIFREAVKADVEQLKMFEQGVIEAERPFNNAIKPEGEGAYYYDLNYLIEDDNSCLLIIEKNDQILATGYAQIRESKVAFRHDKHSYLGFMYVIPDYRGKGLNQKVVEYLIDWSKERGITDFYLDVYVGNEPAIKAYEKLGFEALSIQMKLSF